MKGRKERGRKREGKRTEIMNRIKNSVFIRIEATPRIVAAPGAQRMK